MRSAFVTALLPHMQPFNFSFIRNAGKILLVMGPLFISGSFFISAQVNKETDFKEAVVINPVITEALIKYYYNASFEDYSDIAVRDQIKKIIDGGTYVEGGKAARWLAEVKAGEKRLNLTSSEDAITFMIFYNRLELSFLLDEIADDIFREEVKKVRTEEESNGKRDIVIPEGLNKSRMYIAYARAVLKDDELFAKHPEKEEFDKIRANKRQEIDLFENMHQTWIAYLESFSLSKDRQEQCFKESEEANRLYATDGAKLAIYINRKIMAFAKRGLEMLGGYFESSDMDRAADKLAKKLKKNEEKYAG